MIRFGNHAGKALKYIGLSVLASLVAITMGSVVDDATPKVFADVPIDGGGGGGDAAGSDGDGCGCCDGSGQ